MSFLIRLSHVLPASCLMGVICPKAEKASTSVDTLGLKLAYTSRNSVITWVYAV
jgi:hypothetical protein